MKQLIIVRKDLGMSLGRMADQVSQASMAFVGALKAALRKAAFLFKCKIMSAEYCILQFHPLSGCISSGIL